MKFISAQPDQYYFLWQLQLQLFNFRQLGIPSEDIHVLIAYPAVQGPSREFRNFTENHSYGCFFYYPDQRTRNNYPSSIRPHLLATHFRKYPDLENDCIFFHDSDILLKRMPDWEHLLADNTWYTSGGIWTAIT
jgi:hypothetical protein